MDIRNNTLLMLERRGYNTTIVENNDNYFRTIDTLVVFVSDAKVSIGHTKNILGLRIDNEKIIVVHSKPITPDAKNLMISSKNIELFTYDELGFDILEVIPIHSKVEGPKHKDWKFFPVLLSTDMVSRYFDFKKGDIVRVLEDDGTIIYRKVI